MTTSTAPERAAVAKIIAAADPNAARLVPTGSNQQDATQPLIANACDAYLLTSNKLRRAASAADLAPQPPRIGSLKALDCPSRIGDHLHHRDGRITRLDDTLISTTRGPKHERVRNSQR